MNKTKQFLLLLTVFLAFLPTPCLAYSLGMDVDRYGNVSYSIPSVLGDEDEEEVDKIEKKPEKVERKETPGVKRPEKIEIKNEDNRTTVTFKKQEKTLQELKPERINLKFPSASKTTNPSNFKEDENDIDEKNEEIDDIMREREERKEEKIEIQSEIGDDGKIEFQLESRNVKAKVRDDKIELDVKNNDIESVNSQGNIVKLNHLPDQAEQRFLDFGIASISGSLEVSKSDEGFVYTSEGTRVKKLLGIIPRNVTYGLTLNDKTSQVSQQELSRNIIQQLLNALSF